MSFLTLEQINQIKTNINCMYKLLYDLENQTKMIRQIIDNEKMILHKHCNHNKEIDRTSYNDHTEFYCSVCGVDL